jgi:hypothetical protein
MQHTRSARTRLLMSKVLMVASRLEVTRPSSGIQATCRFWGGGMSAHTHKLRQRWWCSRTRSLTGHAHTPAMHPYAQHKGAAARELSRGLADRRMGSWPAAPL